MNQYGSKEKDPLNRTYIVRDLLQTSVGNWLRGEVSNGRVLRINGHILERQMK
jgi:hypothetical protein